MNLQKKIFFENIYNKMGDMQQLRVVELRKLATEMKIVGRSKLRTRAALLQGIEAARNVKQELKREQNILDQPIPKLKQELLQPTQYIHKTVNAVNSKTDDFCSWLENMFQQQSNQKLSVRSLIN